MATATEEVLLLPTGMAKHGEQTTTTTMHSTATTTMVVPPPTQTANSQQAAAPSHTATPPTQPSNGTAPAGADQFGVSYTPYRANQQCKSQDDIDNDFKQLAGKYSLVRIYGTDCDQASMVYTACKANNMKLFLGIWSPSTVQDEAQKIISGVQNDWSMVHTVSVGNELVNNGQATPEELSSAVDQARSQLRDAGYQGPVVTVDTFTAALAHPEMYDSSDYVAINAHAFFDSSTTASQAGDWLKGTVARVQTAIPNKKVMVTESGWPVEGMSNGEAVPSLENQKAALGSIQETFASTPGDVILFSAFNDLWKKKDAATFDADQYWGINGAVSKCDQ